MTLVTATYFERTTYVAAYLGPGPVRNDEPGAVTGPARGPAPGYRQHLPQVLYLPLDLMILSSWHLDTYLTP